MYGKITIGNYGKIWYLDPCLAVASFNQLDGKEVKKCFNWINLRPMYLKNDFIKGVKIDMRLYLLQQVKANYFLKVNED